MEVYSLIPMQVKALKTFRSIMHLLVAIKRSLSAIVQVFMLILVVFFMFAYMGVLLFGKVKRGCVHSIPCLPHFLHKYSFCCETNPTNSSHTSWILASTYLKHQMEFSALHDCDLCWWWYRHND